ncbi:hypothetical protein DYI37_10910 [Fulvimarina endophytica]|uniref:Nonribosomal peptide synthetase MxaA n=1 Tax=Fulvimarina endophytica TaxID=2293836 RepID=A0A371X2R7_9HYPH|nr:hypothetical protein [Fulvimarina endophytica]RFC63521.1 hypothetical protein DYI37_10910 [Fulvimarina endophytica]
MTEVRPLPLVLAGLLALGVPDGAAAQDAEIGTSSQTPRRVGWFLGDTFTWQGRIEMPDRLEIDPGSLPQAGPIDNFTEIRSIETRSEDAGGTRNYDITIVYQSFYVPLEPREIAIPSLSVQLRSEASGDQERRDAEFSGFSVVLAPLRPILEKSSPDAMRRDKPLTVIDTRRDQLLTAAAWGGLALLALGVGWHRGWGPASHRKARPLAGAKRRIAKLDLETGEGYRTALVLLHRGLDESFGHRLLSEDLDRELVRRPDFRVLGEDLHRFYGASRRLFFAEDEAGARHLLAPDDLRKLGRDLALVERNA